MAPEAIRQLEKIKKRAALQLLIDIAKHEPDLRGMALTALERSATPDLLDDLLLWLETAQRSVDTGCHLVRF